MNCLFASGTNLTILTTVLEMEKQSISWNKDINLTIKTDGTSRNLDIFTNNMEDGLIQNYCTSIKIIQDSQILTYGPNSSLEFPNAKLINDSTYENILKDYKLLY